MSLPHSSLFDIKPPTAVVVAGGIAHNVVGVPFGVYLRVATMWTKAIKLLAGGQITMEEFAEAPEAVGQFIAAGFKLQDSAEAVKWANSLPLDIQMDLFTSIMEQTLGGGAGPFAKRVQVIGNLMNGAPQEQSTENSSPKLEENPTKAASELKPKSGNTMQRPSSVSLPTA